MTEAGTDDKVKVSFPNTTLFCRADTEILEKQTSIMEAHQRPG